jgi:hydrogenase maturation protease
VNRSKGEVCVVGIGSPHGSDAVGWRVVEGLAALLSPAVRVATLAEPTRLMPLLDEYDRMWIVDACRSEQQVGTISRFAWPDDRIDRSWTLSGHGIGMAEVLELAETLGAMPAKTVVYTIDIGREPSDPDGEPTADVAAAVRELRKRLVDEIVGS